jgi:hypothetical protein
MEQNKKEEHSIISEPIKSKDIVQRKYQASLH